MGEKVLSNKEKLDILIPKAMSVLCDMTRRCMPEQGVFQKFFVTFDYPGTAYQAMLWVEPDRTGRAGNGRVTSAMRQDGSDRVIQHYMTVGSKEEIIVWLMCADNAQLLRADYEQLKQAADRLD